MCDEWLMWHIKWKCYKKILGAWNVYTHCNILFIKTIFQAI